MFLLGCGTKRRSSANELKENKLCAMYDYLVVGAGLFGAVCARELKDYGKRCIYKQELSDLEIVTEICKI